MILFRVRLVKLPFDFRSLRFPGAFTRLDAAVGSLLALFSHARGFRVNPLHPNPKTTLQIRMCWVGPHNCKHFALPASAQPSLREGSGTPKSSVGKVRIPEAGSRQVRQAGLAWLGWATG